MGKHGLVSSAVRLALTPCPFKPSYDQAPVQADVLKIATVTPQACKLILDRGRLV